MVQVQRLPVDMNRGTHNTNIPSIFEMAHGVSDKESACLAPPALSWLSSLALEPEKWPFHGQLKVPVTNLCNT